ncbi:MAG: hypothetical protein R3B90_04595 [Planctomycetaceae bacterium]
MALRLHKRRLATTADPEVVPEALGVAGRPIEGDGPPFNRTQVGKHLVDSEFTRRVAAAGHPFLSPASACL